MLYGIQIRELMNPENNLQYKSIQQVPIVFKTIFKFKNYSSMMHHIITCYSIVF